MRIPVHRQMYNPRLRNEKCEPRKFIIVFCSECVSIFSSLCTSSLGSLMSHSCHSSHPFLYPNTTIIFSTSMMSLTVRGDSPRSSSPKAKAWAALSSTLVQLPNAGRMCFSALVMYVASVDSFTSCLFVSFQMM